ncbi:MAG: hypothetical protein U0237_19910 [Thermoleophilia bacterium]
MLKPLEEPPPHSLILISDRPEDLVADDSVLLRPRAVQESGLAGDQSAAHRMALNGPGRGPREVGRWPWSALAGDAFYRSMREVGSVMGLNISLRQVRLSASGRRAGPHEYAAAQNPSQELDLARHRRRTGGKRGGKTAAKKAEDQEK